MEAYVHVKHTLQSTFTELTFHTATNSHTHFQNLKEPFTFSITMYTVAWLEPTWKLVYLDACHSDFHSQN